jgi:hypothetical protein
MKFLPCAFHLSAIPVGRGVWTVPHVERSHSLNVKLDALGAARSVVTGMVVRQAWWCQKRGGAQRGAHTSGTVKFLVVKIAHNV